MYEPPVYPQAGISHLRLNVSLISSFDRQAVYFDIELYFWAKPHFKDIRVCVMAKIIPSIGDNPSALV